MLVSKHALFVAALFLVVVVALSTHSCSAGFVQPTAAQVEEIGSLGIGMYSLYDVLTDDTSRAEFYAFIQKYNITFVNQFVFGQYALQLFDNTNGNQTTVFGDVDVFAAMTIRLKELGVKTYYVYFGDDAFPGTPGTPAKQCQYYYGSDAENPCGKCNRLCDSETTPWVPSPTEPCCSLADLKMNWVEAVVKAGGLVDGWGYDLQVKQKLRQSLMEWTNTNRMPSLDNLDFTFALGFPYEKAAEWLDETKILDAVIFEDYNINEPSHLYFQKNATRSACYISKARSIYTAFETSCCSIPCQDTINCQHCGYKFNFTTYEWAHVDADIAGPYGSNPEPPFEIYGTGALACSRTSTVQMLIDALKTSNDWISAFDTKMCNIPNEQVFHVDALAESSRYVAFGYRGLRIFLEGTDAYCAYDNYCEPCKEKECSYVSPPQPPALTIPTLIVLSGSVTIAASSPLVEQTFVLLVDTASISVTIESFGPDIDMIDLTNINVQPDGVKVTSDGPDAEGLFSSVITITCLDGNCEGLGRRTQRTLEATDTRIINLTRLESNKKVGSEQLNIAYAELPDVDTATTTDSGSGSGSGSGSRSTESFAFSFSSASTDCAVTLSAIVGALALTSAVSLM
eukprot:TRINITY_DN563_c0_g1_i2.p1 TRINITY_DN563_c0_g1~~TRINITY_DN563_c0_g1_i2.p1  ORF type:complete len:626 (+),score=69.20 TRINITY_DN563_c0_g1_i2:141-2018(+)